MLEAIRAHAAACLLREACGVLLGRENEILAGRPVRNLAGAPDRFDADPLQLARIEKRARAAGLQVLGYYHSHPNAAPLPSHADRQCGPWPDLPPYLHLIVSPQHGWKLYNMQAGRWSPVAVEVLAS